MELSQVKLNLRPRNHWAAVDLGIVMVRRWWAPLYLSWFAITLPVYLGVVVITISVFSISHAQLVTVLFWWLKPLWERSQLFILSRAVFGDIPSIRQTVKAFPKLSLIQIIMSLTIRRFSPYRSFDLPVIQLENLSGKDRRKRLAILHSDNNSGVIWTMFACIHIESLLLVSTFGLILVFIPEEMNFNPLPFFTENNSVVELLSIIIGYLCTSLIAPIYVACGFSSYLNRRTILEGWDIELVFRNLRNLHLGRKKSRPEKLKTMGMGMTPMIILILFQMALLSVFSSPAGFAEESLPAVQTEFKQVNRQKQAKERIVAVKAGPDFHTYKINKTAKFRYDWFDGSEKEVDSPWGKWLLYIGGFIAGFFEYILWAGFVAIVLVLIYVNRQDIKKIKQIGVSDFIKLRKNRITTIEESLTISDSDLGKIPESVMALWKQGEHRKALGLLYRSTLQVLVKQHALNLQDSLTEEECVRLVNASQPATISNFFALLTRSWQKVAYGHRILESTLVESISLQWSQIFIPDESR